MIEGSDQLSSGMPGMRRGKGRNFLTSAKRSTRMMTELVIFLKATIVSSAPVQAADRRLYQEFSSDPRPLSLNKRGTGGCHMMHKSDEGFGLFDTTIALIVMGALMVVVLRLSSSVENSQLHAVVKQVRSYRLATYLFRQRYGYWPGDYPYAQENIHLICKTATAMGTLRARGWIRRRRPIGFGSIWLQLD